jgi:hypothetical protein
VIDEVLRVAHIAVLGYWLGAELVINSSYRHVCHAADMPFAARDRLMAHVMDVDQHVRYALVLQAALGTALIARAGYAPGGDMLMWSALGVGALWLAFVEATHRLGQSAIGKRLALADRASRWLLLSLLPLVALLWGEGPVWLRGKLAAFAGVIGCGLAIRIALIGHFRIWGAMRDGGATPEREVAIRRTYTRATAILLLLWAFIALIVALSIVKP